METKIIMKAESSNNILIQFTDGSKDRPPNTFTGISLNGGYQGEATGYIAGNPMKITYTIHRLQENNNEAAKETASKSTRHKTGQKNYAVHPKIIKTNDFEDYKKE